MLSRNKLCIREERLVSRRGHIVFAINNKDSEVTHDNISHVGSPRLKATIGTIRDREAGLAFEFITSGIGYYDFPSDVLLPNQVSHQVFGNLVQPVKTIPGLLPNGENYLDAFISIVSNLRDPENISDLVDSLRRLNPAVQSVLLNYPSRDRILIVHDSGRLIEHELRHESEGFRRYFAQLLALYQQPRKQVLLFEEPEKGIHPGALGSLADEYKAYTSAGHGQIILTTHSPELLDHFDEKSIRVVEMENGITSISPLDTGQAEAIKEELLRPGELLTVTPAIPETAE